MERLSAVLDAWAIIAFLRGEPASPRVREAISSGSLVSWINLGEAIYIEAQRVGLERAQRAIERLTEVVVPREPDAELVRAAAAIKVQHPLSYADAFCVATAERHSLPLWTGDPEIVQIARAGLRIVDLGEPPPPSSRPSQG